VYETDTLQYGCCGGRIKIIAFVVQASQIRKILAHVGLPTEAPKAHPTQRQSNSGVKTVCHFGSCSWISYPSCDSAMKKPKSRTDSSAIDEKFR
jgi:hypothetical protein